MFMTFHTRPIYAQAAVRGQVVSQSSGTPLPGVNIVIKGTTAGTTTDANGEYSITANQDDILVFSLELR